MKKLLDSIFVYLKEGDFRSAEECCNKALGKEPGNPWAYLGKLMVERSVCTVPELENCAEPLDKSKYYQLIVRSYDERVAEEIETYNKKILKRNYENLYNTGLELMLIYTPENFMRAKNIFRSISGYRDSELLATKCENLLMNETIAMKAVEEQQRDSRGKSASGYSSNANMTINGNCYGNANEKDEQKISEGESNIPLQNQCEGDLGLTENCHEVAADVSMTEGIVFLDNESTQNERKDKTLTVAAIVSVICVLVTGIILCLVLYNKDNVSTQHETKKQQSVVNNVIAEKAVSAGGNHTIVLNGDGTVSGEGKNTEGQTNTADWKQIKSVSAGDSHTVGLNENGTVVAVGSKQSGECDVEEWENITVISAGSTFTVGLDKKGNVFAVGDNKSGQCDVDDWKNIVSVDAGGSHTVALKDDGTVVATGNNEYGQCDLATWEDITDVSAGIWHTVGLKSDGTMVAKGYNGSGRCDVDNIKDVAKISAGGFHTVCLKTDGTVVAVGNNDYGQTDVAEWKDIVDISAGAWHTVGVKKDGTVVATGRNNNGQCDF